MKLTNIYKNHKKISLPKRVELMSEVIEEDMDEEDVKEEFRWWRPGISKKLMVNVKNGLLF